MLHTVVKMVFSSFTRKTSKISSYHVISCHVNSCHHKRQTTNHIVTIINFLLSLLFSTNVISFYFIFFCWCQRLFIRFPLSHSSSLSFLMTWLWPCCRCRCRGFICLFRWLSPLLPLITSLPRADDALVSSLHIVRRLSSLFILFFVGASVYSFVFLCLTHPLSLF